DLLGLHDQGFVAHRREQVHREAGGLELLGTELVLERPGCRHHDGRAVDHAVRPGAAGVPGGQVRPAVVQGEEGAFAHRATPSVPVAPAYAPNPAEPPAAPAAHDRRIAASCVSKYCSALGEDRHTLSSSDTTPCSDAQIVVAVSCT